MNTVVIALEGVLAVGGDDMDLVNAQVDDAGRLLYATFAARARLLLATRQERRLVDHWCRLQGMTHHQGLVALDDRVVGRLRAAGEVLDLYIDADGDRAAAALRHGVPTLLFSRPLFARMGHRPDLARTLTKPRPWATLVAEARAQREAKTIPLTEEEG